MEPCGLLGWLASVAGVEGPTDSSRGGLTLDVRPTAGNKKMGGSLRNRPACHPRTLDAYLGRRTVSITWMTPLEAITSPLITLASFTITPMLSFLIIMD